MLHRIKNVRKYFIFSAFALILLFLLYLLIVITPGIDFPVSFHNAQLPTAEVFCYGSHRGADCEPENTEGAVKEAIARGFHYVEVDVQWTKDNIPVLLHDTSIDRTSNGKGLIADMYCSEAAAYTYGASKLHPQGEPLPILEPLLREIGQRDVILELDCAAKNFTEQQWRILTEMVHRYGMEDKIVFCVTLQEAQKLKMIDTNVRVCLFQACPTLSSMRESAALRKSFRHAFVSHLCGNVSKWYILYAHRHGISVRICAVCDLNQRDVLRLWGVDVILCNETDYPDENQSLWRFAVLKDAIRRDMRFVKDLLHDMGRRIKGRFLPCVHAGCGSVFLLRFES